MAPSRALLCSRYFTHRSLAEACHMAKLIAMGVKRTPPDTSMKSYKGMDREPTPDPLPHESCHPQLTGLWVSVQCKESSSSVEFKETHLLGIWNQDPQSWNLK